jgi:drug/metabolite transporter (DMT)-like permease
MGLVYPVARGAAPLMTAAVAVLLLGERIAPLALAGVVLLGGGIMALALQSRSAGRDQRTGFVFAALTAFSIMLYTFADGLGGRISGNVHGYALVNFVLNGISIALIGLVKRGPAVFSSARPLLPPAIAGAAMTLGSYWISIWAMTQAPIPLVAATRETSVLFASLFAIMLLGERASRLRIFSALIIVSGLMLMRLA